jgi:hypothetical protein
MKWLRIALFALLPASLAAACAAGVQRGPGDGDEGDGGDGGDVTGGSSSGAGGKLDGGPPPDAMIPCIDAADCAWFNDTCNVGSCVNGLCGRAPANEYGACDDGLFCTDNDTCIEGTCTGGTSKYCPSLDLCHLGVCDEELKTCKNIAGNDGAQCDDGDLCTASGVCGGGVCAKGPPVSCDIFASACSFGVCDPAVGCKSMPTNEGSFCDDGKSDNCSQGQCQSGLCVSLPVNDGSFCDDSLFCTINDKCVAGSCSGDPNPCAPPDNPCMVGMCNEFSWSCSVVPAPNGSACDDANLCTGGDACQNGQCVGGPPANDGAMCDDANGCTGGTTCLSGTCQDPESEIMQCGSGDSCCPAGCTLAQDADCLYWASGVQKNVNPASLIGWTQCYSGTYADNFPPLQTILTQCDKSKLLLACRPTGQPTFTLVAMANRLDVLFDCGQQLNCTKQSNGVGWYYSASYSWGFAPGGQPVSRQSCDYNDGSQLSPELRMCWHTSGSITTGYRCGSNNLNNDFSWERVVYEAD